MFSMIVAMDKNNLIGNNKSKNGLPWNYPEDLQFYKKMTINKKNIMGSKTYDEIGRALPNRETYVLTRDINKKYNDAIMLYDIDDVLNLEKKYPDEEIMIIGGKEIFDQLINHINTIYLTKINKEYEGDVYYDTFSTEGFIKSSSKKGKNNDLVFETWTR